MTEEYHTPKDLVNKRPLTIGLEVFNKNNATIDRYDGEPFQRINNTSAGGPDSVKINLTLYISNISNL